MAIHDDLILTLDSEPEDVVPQPPTPKTKSALKKKELGTGTIDDDATLNPEFNFDLNASVDTFWMGGKDNEEEDTLVTGSKPKRITVDDIIERRKARSSAPKKRKRDETNIGQDGAEDESDKDDEDMVSNESLSDDESSEDGFGMGAEDETAPQDESDEESDEDGGTSVVDHEADDRVSSDDSDEDEETEEQKERKAAYFAPEPVETADTDAAQAKTFMGLNLSRPILRAVQAMNFTTPTPIQRKAIPVALQGLDVLGSAVTGSGKTAAFMIPILERLTFKDRNGSGEIRVLILMPTRELAMQCAEVAKSLARFMDVTFAVIVGGLSLKVQETSLRARPDVVIATPGRLIDHIHNTPSFTLSALDILVLDEADRMLQDGFAAELAEIIQSCPKSRQTMLFSATMTDDVDSLVRLSMNRPVRLFVDPKKTVARALVQEFVRVRKESDRQAILATICRRTAKRNTIVFFRSKVLCHQMKVVFGLLGLRAAELHGNLTQEMRMEALKQFRDREVDYLLATDVASRGLDIKGVESVINYDMPSQIELYLHRVGRTARASSKGRSISLVGEPDRKMLKAVIKRSEADKIKHRVLPPDSVKSMAERLEVMKGEVTAVLEEEQEERAVSEMEATKLTNMVEHRDEILARPKRTWFESERDKGESKVLSRDQYTANFEGVQDDQPKGQRKKKPLNHQGKRRKEALETMKNDKSSDATVRNLKKAARPTKITWAPSPVTASKPAGKRSSARPPPPKRRKTNNGKAGFDREMGVKSAAGAREGARSKRGDNVPLKDKKGRGASGKGKGGAKGKGKSKFKRK